MRTSSKRSKDHSFIVSRAPPAISWKRLARASNSDSSQCDRVSNSQTRSACLTSSPRIAWRSLQADTSSGSVCASSSWKIAPRIVETRSVLDLMAATRSAFRTIPLSGSGLLGIRKSIHLSISRTDNYGLSSRCQIMKGCIDAVGTKVLWPHRVSQSLGSP